jgi:hypothetical protein
MSNYYGAERTNYFEVDPTKREAFDAWVKHFKLETLECKAGIALFPGGWSDDGTFPSYDEAREKKDPLVGGEVDFMQELSKFLAPGSVAIMMSSGAEKLRYVDGHATAVDHTGKEVWIALHQIYDLVNKEFPGATVTDCSY